MTNQSELINKAKVILEKQLKRINQFLNQYYHKPYAIESRIKDFAKLKIQQELYLARTGKIVEINKMPDIIGIRIAVADDSEVIFLSSLIRNYLEPTKIVDYFNNPKDSGFKSFIYYFENDAITTEVQIMTISMMYFANNTQRAHDEIKYAKVLKLKA